MLNIDCFLLWYIVFFAMRYVIYSGQHMFSLLIYMFSSMCSRSLCCSCLMFALFVISQLQNDDVHLSLTTSCVSQLCDYTETSSERNMMQAACGRWLCEAQTLMKADKHHKPVGSKKHWARNQKLHSSLHGFLLRHPPWRPHPFSLCWLQKAQGSLRGDLRRIVKRKHS